MRFAILGLIIFAGGCAGPVSPPNPTGDSRVMSDPWGAPGSPARGEILAQMRCSGCHAVGRFDRSAAPAAPPFRGLEQRYPVANLQEAFAEGLVTAHPTMPEFQFEENDIADLIAYLESVGSAEVRSQP